MNERTTVRVGAVVLVVILALAGAYGLLQNAEAAQPLQVLAMPALGLTGLDTGAVEGSRNDLLSSTDNLCRLGYALSDINYLDTFNQPQLSSLRSGWYLNFGTMYAPPHKFGMEFTQIVRLHQVKAGPTNIYTTTYAMPYTYTMRPSMSDIAVTAAANKGSLWLVGNEIDRRDWRCAGPGDTHACSQDEMLPEVYADAYHDIYNDIKQADPTARVAIAGVVEVTPMRLAYLDKIWNAYQTKYGTNIPVDVWNTHIYILPEKFDNYGAETPPGEAAPIGVPYGFYQHDDVNIFKQQVQLFRAWMATKGEQSKPLVLSEFGILYPTWVTDEFGNPYSIARVNTYMNGTFDYLFATTSPTMGYSLDSNRLVQQWNWVSLDFDPAGINGNLFVTSTASFSPIGQNWANYLTNHSKNLGPTVNFKALAVSYSDAPAPNSALVVLKLSNAGSYNWTTPVTVAVKRPDGSLLGQATFSPAHGCGDISYASVVASNITQTIVGAQVQIDPGHNSPDPDFTDNNISFTLVYHGQRVYLPDIQR